MWNSLLFELLICNKSLTIAVMVLYFVWRDGVMLPVTIFPVYDLFSQLAYTLAEQIPIGIRTWLDVGVATERIEVVLQCSYTRS